MAGTGLDSTRAPIVRTRLVRLRWSFILFLILGLLAITSEIYIFESLRQTWFLSLKPIPIMRNLVLLSVAASVLGQTGDTFYPTLNGTSYISNSSIGTYGGVYEAPTNGPTGGNPYGIYDYCSMPHPRSEEYKLPEALTSGSTKGKLVYLEYLQRHQRRTPYNILPGGEVSNFQINYQPKLTHIPRTKHITATMCARISTQALTAQATCSPCQCMHRHTRIPPTPSRPA
jgi:hypothetical protein